MEEQDHEESLRDLEQESDKMEDQLEEQRRDTEGVRTDWESQAADTGVPGAQEKESLQPAYGGRRSPRSGG